MTCIDASYLCVLCAGCQPSDLWMCPTHCGHSDACNLMASSTKCHLTSYASCCSKRMWCCPSYSLRYVFVCLGVGFLCKCMTWLNPSLNHTYISSSVSLTQSLTHTQHLTNTLWGLARLGFLPGRTWNQAFLNATGPKLHAMQAPELVSLAWAVGRLRMMPGPAWIGQLLLVRLCACLCVHE